MKNAVLLLLLSVFGAPATPERSTEPAASVETMPPGTGGDIAAVEEVLGAWRGHWELHDAPSIPLEVVFSHGHRARTVFAYVTLVEPSGERTLRRLARLTEAGLELDVPGRGEVVLRAEGGARLVAPGLTLVRLRR